MAWIHSSDYQILRMRTDLLAPQPRAALRRMTTVVLFAGIELEGGRTALRLPQEVDVSMEQGNSLSSKRQPFKQAIC